MEFHARKKMVKLVHLVGVIIKKFVTMHGHMKVKRTRQFGSARLGLALCGPIQGDLVRCFICEFRQLTNLSANFKNRPRLSSH